MRNGFSKLLKERVCGPQFLRYSILIIVILLLAACRSSPAPTTTTSTPSTTPTTTTPSSTTSTPAEPAPVYVPPATTTTPPASTPPATTVTTTTPDTTPGSAYGTTPGAVTGSTGTSSGSSGTGSGTGSGLSGRHSSGIILDGASYYTVVSGDTLSGIARALYRDGSLYPLIMMVSDIVVDPDEILPEMVLIIPALRVNMDDATARASINRYFLEIAAIEDQRGRHQTAALIRNHTR